MASTSAVDASLRCIVLVTRGSVWVRASKLSVTKFSTGTTSRLPFHTFSWTVVKWMRSTVHQCPS